MADMRMEPNLACTHALWPCCSVCFVCSADGSLHLNIYQGQ